MSLKLINDALVLLHDMHGHQADKLVTLLRKVRANWINEVDTAASAKPAAKPVVKTVEDQPGELDPSEVDDLILQDSAATLERMGYPGIEEPEAPKKPKEPVVTKTNKKPELLADVIAKKGKRGPGRPKKV